MKRHLIIAMALLLLATPPVVRAQELEDTIEDELGRSSLDEQEESTDSTEENIEEELGGIDEEEEAPAAEPKAKAAAPTPTPAPTEEAADPAEEDVAEIEDTIESEESEEQAPAKTAQPEVETETQPAAEAPEKPERKVRAKTIYAETLGDFDDQANPQFEARIYEIFSKRKPVGDEQWTTLVGRNSTGIYRVQRGDTLWDISQTFFGDGAFWPRLWSENSSLTNPHEISVGKGIAFIAGTEESAPSVSITDVKTSRSGDILDTSSEPSTPVYPEDPEAQLTDDDVAAGTVLEEQPIVGGRPEIPEPLVTRKPVLKNLPPSFVEPVSPKAAKEFDNTGLDVGRRKAFEAAGALYVPAYLSDGKPDGVGTVDEIMTRDKAAVFLQDVIVSLKRQATVGERFSALNVRGNVSNPKTRTYGPVIDVGGLVEIKEVISSERNVYRGTVIVSVGPIEAGALLSETPLPKVEFSKKGPRVDLEGTIIGGQYSKDRRVLAAGAVVYLDKGSINGLADGQLLAVRSDRLLRKPNTKFEEYSKPIAVIKLVRVLERVSTAIIVDGSEEVRPGDITGGPLPKPAETMNNNLRAQTKAIEIKDRDEEEYKEEFDEEVDEDEMDEEF